MMLHFHSIPHAQTASFSPVETRGGLGQQSSREHKLQQHQPQASSGTAAGNLPKPEFLLIKQHFFPSRSERQNHILQDFLNAEGFLCSSTISWAGDREGVIGQV